MPPLLAIYIALAVVVWIWNGKKKLKCGNLIDFIQPHQACRVFVCEKHGAAFKGGKISDLWCAPFALIYCASWQTMRRSKFNLPPHRSFISEKLQGRKRRRKKRWNHGKKGHLLCTRQSTISKKRLINVCMCITSASSTYMWFYGHNLKSAQTTVKK